MDEDKIIKIWEAYASKAEEITNKRQTINALFISAEIAILGFVVSNLKILGICLSIAGLLVSIAWFFMIISYKKLSKAKHEVIGILENEMLVKPYKEEWNNLKRDKYIKLTTIEMAWTIIFAIGFVITLIISILSMLGGI